MSYDRDTPGRSKPPARSVRVYAALFVSLLVGLNVWVGWCLCRA